MIQAPIRIGGARAIPAFVRAVEDASPEAVLAAAWALELLTGDDFGASEGMKKSDPDRYVKAAARARDRVREWARQPK